MTEPTTALALLSETDALPVPRFTGAQMVDALAQYRALQAALDAQLPDAMVRIRDRVFRKKTFWRAISVAFDVSLELVEEQREVRGVFHDGTDNFGYLITYRASTRTGRSMIGDGACFAVDKAERHLSPEQRWARTSAQATEHNVRSHAHTRAKNRAIADLVGFGEVSAEEIDREEIDAERDGRPSAPPPTRASSAPPPSTTPLDPRDVITEPQAKRLWAKARAAGWGNDEVHDHLKRYGYAHVGEIRKDIYDQIVAELEAGVDGTATRR